LEGNLDKKGAANLSQPLKTLPAIGTEKTIDI